MYGSRPVSIARPWSQKHPDPLDLKVKKNALLIFIFVVSSFGGEGRLPA